MQLITEIQENITSEEILNEKTQVKERFISGIFLQADVKNRNGRVYPLPVLRKEVSRFNTEMIQKDRAVGELSHPMSPSINYDRASHKIVKLEQVGTNFVGKALILDTPMGKIVEGLLKANVNIGVSSRGMGSVSVNKQGVNEVQDDFILATVDVVSDPSAPQAFVKGIMENADWVYENGVFKQEKIKSIKKTVRKTSKRNLGEVYVDLFEKFLNSHK